MLNSWRRLNFYLLIVLTATGFAIFYILLVLYYISVGVIAFVSLPDGSSTTLRVATVTVVVVSFLTQSVDDTSLSMRGILWCCA